MHYPVEHQIMACLKQAEMLKEAAERRVARQARADTPQAGLRALVVGLGLAAAVVGLVLLTAALWAG